MELQKCKICGQEKKNLGVHIRVAHRLKPEEYAALPDNTEIKVEIDPILEDESVEIQQVNKKVVEPKVEVKQKPFEKVKINTETISKYDKYNIKQFCSEFAITPTELVIIVNDYKSGKPRNQLSLLKNDIKKAETKAEELKDLSEASTSESHVADILVKKFGFTVVKVEKSPKKWILKK
ncbi:hypothetical protein AUJ83_03130 [Candidatus Woesearchaeota archaeon CG1_02_33_12]|nr:MAG: hypothetical protein AUJ83_03130 [Candidatus Woesearchaeota archaeon CG1_02_33_12]